MRSGRAKWMTTGRRAMSLVTSPTRPRVSRISQWVAGHLKPRRLRQRLGHCRRPRHRRRGARRTVCSPREQLVRVRGEIHRAMREELVAKIERQLDRTVLAFIDQSSTDRDTVGYM